MNQRQASFLSGESSTRQSSAFRAELLEQAAPIFVGTLLPSAVRVGKVDVGAVKSYAQISLQIS